MTVGTRTYEQATLDDPNGFWELHNGRLRQNPDQMTFEQTDVQDRLVACLNRQLDEDEYAVSSNTVRTWRTTYSFYIPDVAVIPRALI